MAEMIYREQTRLPDRFRYKPVEYHAVTLTRTVPVSPMLHTYARKVGLFNFKFIKLPPNFNNESPFGNWAI